MSHTEVQDVTYYNGHVIEVNGKRYVRERTCSNVHEPPPDYTFWPCPHFKCSLCGKKHISMDYVFYCPNCGAKVID